MMSQVQRTDDPPSTDVLNSVGMKRSMDGTSNASNSPKRRLSDDQEPVDEVLTCRVPGCEELVNEETLRNSHRVKLCLFHQKVDSVDVAGVPHRFCQQCTRLHPLDMFDGEKRGCRKRLERHNRRRQRKAKIMRLKGEGGVSFSVSGSGATGTTGNHTFTSAPAHMALWDGTRREVGLSSVHSAHDSADPGGGSSAPWGAPPVSRDTFLERSCTSFSAGTGSSFMQRVASRGGINLNAVLEPWGNSSAGGGDIKAALEPWGISSSRHTMSYNHAGNQQQLQNSSITQSMMSSQAEDSTYLPSNTTAPSEGQQRNWMGVKQEPNTRHSYHDDFHAPVEGWPLQQVDADPSMISTCQPYVNVCEPFPPSISDMLGGNMASHCMQAETLQQPGNWPMSSEGCRMFGQRFQRSSYH